MSARNEYVHQPVLLNEVVAALAIKPDGIYIDGTYGRGGHSAAVLERLTVHGRLLALDKDPEAVKAARARFESDTRFTITQASFGGLGEWAERLRLTGKVDGLLLDLGLSSPQVDDPTRGFSFTHDGPLDMRMNPEHGPTAAQWLLQTPETEIAEILRSYGEERFARRIAHAIVTQTQRGAVATTAQLANLIEAAVPRRKRHKHPATRTFQAIRIFLNRELDELRAALTHSLFVLAAFGRLAVISFHSLEDRIVKRFIRRHSGGEPSSQGFPPAPDQTTRVLRRIGKPVRPTAAECARNPRARSAVLRVAEKLP
ncbi:MAG: 16S rRNA (cytosine(1402)-N(4))-methyltransferase RsmH [Pseudomonadota bacterium]|nr:16S rRNA (cytosine(1402)-N(4))-methyltransferase RsmH [Pseudomonadota bacterium]